MALFTVQASADDASEAGGTVTINGTTSANALDAAGEWVGVRFAVSGTGPPQGATIDTAVLSVVPNVSGNDEPLVTIKGELSVSSAAFTTGASNISGRTPTTATVVWSSTDLGATGSSRHDSPSLVTILQELVNQASWTTSSAMTILIESQGTSTRDLAFFMQDNGSNAPELTVTWSTGGQPTWKRLGGLPFAAPRIPAGRIW